jgi:hypothetical protein
MTPDLLLIKPLSTFSSLQASPSMAREGSRRKTERPHHILQNLSVPVC